MLQSTKPTELMPHEPVNCPICYSATQDIQSKCKICLGTTICSYKEAIDAVENEQVWTAEHFEGLKRAISLMRLDPYRVAVLFMDEDNVSHPAYNLFYSYDVNKDALEEVTGDERQFKEALRCKHWCIRTTKDKRLDDLLWLRTHKPECGSK